MGYLSSYVNPQPILWDSIVVNAILWKTLFSCILRKQWFQVYELKKNRQATPRQTTLKLALPRLATPKQATPRQVTPSQATSRYATHRYATHRQTTPRQATSTKATPTKTMPTTVTPKKFKESFNMLQKNIDKQMDFQSWPTFSAKLKKEKFFFISLSFFFFFAD